MKKFYEKSEICMHYTLVSATQRVRYEYILADQFDRIFLLE